MKRSNPKAVDTEGGVFEHDLKFAGALLVVFLAVAGRAAVYYREDRRIKP
ncbi:MAG TPA: hypothetical protein PKE26_11820 [Kiritimatiellia bacterium]|nr:hypothetical protein [Kiritimatiellia bacterium]HMO99788.1 hypothetical protein [Kiritimatiellia bacterium]